MASPDETPPKSDRVTFEAEGDTADTEETGSDT